MSSGPSAGATLALVRGYNPAGDDASARSRERTIDLLAHNPAPFDRATFEPGHVTASALVLSPDYSRLLLVFHSRLRRWLQPGGHIEPADDDVHAAARRELLEETGVSIDEPAVPPLVGIDVHGIPAARREPFHYHHDLMFGFVAAQTPRAPAQADSHSTWCPLDRLDAYGIDGALRRSVTRALESVGSAR